MKPKLTLNGIKRKIIPGKKISTNSVKGKTNSIYKIPTLPIINKTIAIIIYPVFLFIVSIFISSNLPLVIPDMIF